ncbi:hypothetical protein JOD67_005183 [Tenggerimyces flavus]|nr:hypothetical protein [Tenggerimyces flavus]
MALGFQLVGLVPLVYGLVVLDAIAVVTGTVIVQLAASSDASWSPYLASGRSTWRTPHVKRPMTM